MSLCSAPVSELDTPAAAAGERAARDGRPVRGAVAPWRTANTGRGAPADPDRRQFLQLGILALGAIAVASIAAAWPWRSSLATPPGTSGGLTGSASPIPESAGGASPAPPSATTASPVQSAPPGGTTIGQLDQLKSRGSLYFRDPGSGEPGIVVEMKDGSVAGFDAACTHEGCTVGSDPTAELLFCPCHGAVFDPALQAAVVQGPARRPLPACPIQVDGSTGAIYLKA